MMYDLLNFKVHGDNTGNLVALEKDVNLPFEIKRVYYIWGTAEKVVRGKHAHRKLEHVIVCISGSCDFVLDNGKERVTVHLNSPSQGLYIKHNIWRSLQILVPIVLSWYWRVSITMKPIIFAIMKHSQRIQYDTPPV